MGASWSDYDLSIFANKSIQIAYVRIHIPRCAENPKTRREQMLSLSEFKSLLQISVDTYDDLFAIYEPVVADVVKQITRVSYGLTF